VTRDFFATQLVEIKHAYSAYNEDTWGAAEKPRRFRVDFELVIFMETGGDPLMWEPDMALPAFPLLLRREFGGWYIANFRASVPVPGWPPTEEELPLGGIAFRPMG
jgi:hypothetical protein